MSIWNGTMTLTLGEGCDDDTIRNLFGRWADEQYRISINDIDIAVTDVCATGPDDEWSIAGWPVDDEGLIPDRIAQLVIPWNQVRSIHVY